MLRSARNNRGDGNYGLYDPIAYKKRYTDHNMDVINYFSGRPNDFICINVAQKEDFQRLCEFLHVKTNITGLPWENKS
jgi:hypothetical protein